MGYRQAVEMPAFIKSPLRHYIPAKQKSPEVEEEKEKHHAK
jgi:hypothetical protein